MMKSFLILVAAMCAFTAPAGAASPDPLQMERSLYSDLRAARVGDVISVIVSESNSATKNARTSSMKSNKAEAEGEATTGALGGLFPGLGGGMDVSNQYSGQGATTLSGQFSSRITVKVLDILPNGNLVVEGTKTMEINEETEVITISGLVQPTDITSANTIYSYQIANAKITYKGRGTVSHAQRPGILVRIINWLL